MVTTKDLLKCPITGEPMIDPVIDPEGNSFERSAILAWLSHSETSPLTRSVLRPDQLLPNRVLRELLQQKDDDDDDDDGDVDVDDTATAATTGEYENNSVVGLNRPAFQVNLQGICKRESYKTGLLHPSALVKISVSEDPSLLHSPTTVVCVIDVSYSMRDAATMYNDSEGSAGLSQLDVVKHATRTVIETLADYDQLAIVAFSDSARIAFPISKMTAENRSRAWKAVQDLNVVGATNLYAGLYEAMELLRKDTIDNVSHTSPNIILLTDGLPNIHPPRGEIHTLLRYQEAHPGFSPCISTFGFGYNLDTNMLMDIAVAGHGHFCFIPDSSFVGTVFVNATSNILATAIPKATLRLEAASTDIFVDPHTSPTTCSEVSSSRILSIAIPSLLYGQTFDVLVRLRESSSTNSNLSSPLFHASLEWEGQEGARTEVTAVSWATQDQPNMAEDTELLVAAARGALVSLAQQVTTTPIGSANTNNSRHFMRELQDLLSETKQLFKALQARVRASSTVLQALQEDLEGQITEALSSFDYFKRWGCHYLASLGRAHTLQQCTNFKDPGLQIYATKKFAGIRDISEDKFCKLPPPIPSLARYRDRDSAYTPVQSMSGYYDSHAPCFAAGQVKLADGTFVDVSMVRVGDSIAVPAGWSASSAKVQCVVITECADGMEELVELEGGVRVTPWHPVRPTNTGSFGGAGSWSFPADIAQASLVRCEKVYSFVLEEDLNSGSNKRFGAMQIGPYDAVTLGHGIADDKVATHPYLGTHCVVDDLSCMIGWEDGEILLGSNPVVRDSETHLIVRFHQHATVPVILPAVENSPIIKWRIGTSRPGTDPKLLCV